ncbi:bifunctional UDP-N-acetylglucosamine diphosphorylase/glucosamine-1-phosphate N-acetyltransferase GlmU [Thermophilibacter provencensis]|uniref:Bifunctional protein GlmU n=1 Tax=Thermophilibacter provencensis TaxID=1852386 RepID=A0A921GGQ0_9ACTN|nr:bifunctional UDP-N-acetylglucosamine diphosphorylase/glucosamine-1-phosphate N-acetyltransferase GlmU [Thermophilibacter provencensis]MBM6814506.1 bifunctional UDP-N-acetylglucosamine diphosphorylase/glucosamine-1-phosphate N-acetyltransferase GlmU [Olsenella uli]HJF45691.1 bifunctional UDP-N-acetylglucosamine diphosphorylase/glucosamine-1-phosphate N-acetyltransferase GlmU [Thermophilibacter provencensis]
MPMTAIILAAGEGTRMKSRHPKVMHKLLDRPLVSWVTRAARAAGAERIVVVVGNGAQEVRDHLANEKNVEFVEQAERLGTGHAVRVALEATGIDAGPVVILNGDLPLIEPKTVRAFAESVADGGHAASVLTMTPPDPHGYGRIELAEDGTVARIIEQKDCTSEQDARLLECNAGCYAFDGALLAAHVSEIGNDNAQGEYYLPDMVEILRGHGHATTIVHCEDYREGLGANNRVQLAELAALARDRINERLMLDGVTMLDPATTWVGPDVTVGRDTVLLPMTMLWGATSVGEECVLGPNTRLTDCTVADHVTLEETVGVDVTIEKDVTCGPRAYLRGGAHVLAGAHVGTHVEIKNSVIGEGSKVPHLSYIGDCTMGAGVNIGGGSITCNYDGVHKNRTVIGDNVFVGSDTMMVAPVTIGDGALVGASSCVTKDVPADALYLERSKERIVEGYAARRLERLKKGEA